MTDELAFIRDILAEPSAHAPRLVYADWLEERGDADSLQRAEFLRVEVEMEGLSSRDPKRRRLQERLKQLRGLVGDDWWQQLDWAKVEYCIEFEYRCPQRWDTLQPTDDDALRHCTECQRNVYYCRSSSEVLRLADAGECVALDSRAARISLQFVRARREAGRMLGRVAPRVPNRLPLGERGKPME